MTAVFPSVGHWPFHDKAEVSFPFSVPLGLLPTETKTKPPTSIAPKFVTAVQDVQVQAKQQQRVQQATQQQQQQGQQQHQGNEKRSEKQLGKRTTSARDTMDDEDVCVSSARKKFKVDDKSQAQWHPPAFDQAAAVRAFEFAFDTSLQASLRPSVLDDDTNASIVPETIAEGCDLLCRSSLKVLERASNQNVKTGKPSPGLLLLSATQLANAMKQLQTETIKLVRDATIESSLNAMHSILGAASSPPSSAPYSSL